MKRCTCCGTRITSKAWQSLKLVGHQPQYDANGDESRDVRLELRNCVCGTTLSIEQSLKHSPAPWSVTDPEDGHNYLCITSRSGTNEAEDVATVSVDRLDIHPNAVANANVLAAAPELLERLEFAVQMFRSNRDEMHPDDFHAAIRGMDAVIAKARGGR